MCIRDRDHEISEVRKVYGQTVEQMILDGRPVMVCDADLAGSSGAGYLYDKYPKHTVNFGICEANMVAAAAAMSRIGIRPVSYTHLSLLRGHEFYRKEKGQSINRELNFTVT